MLRKLLPLGLLLLAANASPQVLPASADPAVMTGFPPPPAKRVTRKTQVDAANLHWTLTHMRILLPSIAIRRGPQATEELPIGRSIGLPAFEDIDGTLVRPEEWLLRTHSDALLIMHDGKIIFEGYVADMDPAEPHTMQSMTKSFTGLLAGMLIDEGRIDPQKPISFYVPELAGSAWGKATVQQTLDMRAAVRYDEDIKNSNSDVRRYYGVAAGLFPPPEGYDGPLSIYELLERLPQDGAHGKGFIYKSVHPEAIAWVISRVTGQSPAKLISERIWQPLGMTADAYVTVDPAGIAMMGGGMSATARDLARFGEMLRQRGRHGPRQIVPARVTDRLFSASARTALAVPDGSWALPGYGYHDFWWLPPEGDIIEAHGGFGQHLHINRRARTVIVKFSSAPIGPEYDLAKRLDTLAFRKIDAAF